MPRKIKKIENFNKSEKGLDPWSEVWTVCMEGREIGRIFINKTEAEQVAEEKNKEYYDYNRAINTSMTDEEYTEYHKDAFRNNIYKVWTLIDAIDNYKDECIDDVTYQGEEY